MKNKGRIANFIFACMVFFVIAIIFVIFCVLPLSYNLAVTDTKQDLDFGEQIDLSAMIEYGEIVFYKSPLVDLGIVQINNEKDSTKLSIANYDSSVIGNQNVTIKYGLAKGVLYCQVNELQIMSPVVVKMGDNISWDSVTNATSYSVWVNGEKRISQEEISYDLANFIDSSYVVQVVAETDINGYIASEKSNSISVNVKVTSFISADETGVYWGAIDDVTGYDVLVNDAPYSPIDTHINVDWVVGENVVEVKGRTDDNSDVMLTSTIVITKLEAPVLSIVDGIIQTNNAGGTYVYYYNSEEISNDLSNIEPGIYDIYAVRKATSTNQVDSDLSEKLTVEKLSVPDITLNDGVVYYNNDSGNMVLYCDAVLDEDGDLNDLSVGEHKIYAVNMPTESNQISSKSEIITVTKLVEPILDIDSGELVADEDKILEGFTYYFGDDDDFDNLDELSEGSYVVYAENVASSEWEITSNPSNTLDILIPDMGFKLSEATSSRLLIELDTKEFDNFTLYVEYIYYGEVKDTKPINVDSQEVYVSTFISGIRFNEIAVTLEYSSNYITKEFTSSYNVS